MVQRGVSVLMVFAAFAAGCGEKAEDRARREAAIAAAETRAKLEFERAEARRADRAKDNIENTMIKDAKKCFRYSRSSFEDYEIEKRPSGFVLEGYRTTQKYNELGEAVFGRNRTYYYTYRIKYDSNGKFSQCLSKTKK
jgi:hypothetical protein